MVITFNITKNDEYTKHKANSKYENCLLSTLKNKYIAQRIKLTTYMTMKIIHLSNVE